MKEKAIILAFGGGGHNAQMKRLLNNIQEFILTEEDVKFISICNVDVRTPITKKTYYFRLPLFKESFKEIYKLPFLFLKGLKLSSKINKVYDAKMIISTGPLIGVLFSLIYKMRGVKVIYVETWSRFYSKSLSGKLAYMFSDYFFIQNISLKTVYPKAIYCSRL